MGAAFPELRPRQKLRVFGGERRGAAPSRMLRRGMRGLGLSLAQGWGVRTRRPREASLGPLVNPLQLTACPSSRGLGPSCRLCISEVPSKLVMFYTC